MTDPASLDPASTATVQSICCAQSDVCSQGPWELPHVGEAASTARQVTRAALETWGAGEDCVYQAQLVVSELVTNAVEHALPPITLRLERPQDQETVHLAVVDGGAAAEEGSWTASCAPDEHGRGHGIIEALTLSSGSQRDAHCTTYWADVPLAA
ncbi:ATP-binding protein [Kitasatospora mediocidica]|uniref:ATP-binding protein n=1 Tax=Kitasatospora mediocidica TaxID=58352 RepID=UPI000A0111BF|nr:ATP-binding protein [Kitasatospora mediocidica]